MVTVKGICGLLCNQYLDSQETGKVKKEILVVLASLTNIIEAKTKVIGSHIHKIILQELFQTKDLSGNVE